ncbi:hypothetical protein E2C01_029366 [Portunus trituberculatus]|uniref:Uncharacterized protein n=1 Tax=Portunus trituberculatus TaxID=210409 RepID=A0A5B7ERP3_PORTR|nr:hypothetical protein [Portunus trituberculatus]
MYTLYALCVHPHALSFTCHPAINNPYMPHSFSLQCFALFLSLQSSELLETSTIRYDNRYVCPRLRPSSKF